MEALRLLSSAGPTAQVAGLAAEHNLLPDPSAGPLPVLTDRPAFSSDAWDAALFQTHLAEMLSAPGVAPVSRSSVTAAAASQSDPAALASGLSQLNKYLSRAWYRAAIPVQSHEDSSQAVYATLLQHLGRARFDALVSDVGHSGIKDVFTRETNEGVAFFRAVDMVKKRAQRERLYQSLDSVEAPASSVSPETQSWREALREAIDHNLSPREASLINDTLMGKTPAEIALHWGVAPKTISNEKTRVLQKLRDVLLAQAPD
jgi:DNA-binding NarL/FixJ family response regulator